MFRSLVVGAVVAAALALPSLANADPILYEATLDPLNNSGVSGTAMLSLDGNLLTVTINATGLVPNEPHPQHIHGLLGADAPLTSPPTLAQDTNHDGFINLAEGQVTYGPILLPLTSPPGGALANFPTAPGGVVNFTQTYNLTDPSIYNDGFTEADLLPLNEREIVLHGMFAPPGFIPSDPSNIGPDGYDAVLPVADGLIQAVPEPTSLSLLLLAGLVGGLAGLRGRKRA